MKLKADGMELFLPKVQKLRGLSRALNVRFRAEIAQCRFDDAIRTAETMFAKCRHLGEHPTLIGDLVGIAIAAVANNGMEEMLEQPSCPNLRPRPHPHPATIRRVRPLLYRRPVSTA